MSRKIKRWISITSLRQTSLWALRIVTCFFQPWWVRTWVKMQSRKVAFTLKAIIITKESLKIWWKTIVGMPTIRTKQCNRLLKLRRQQFQRWGQEATAHRVTIPAKLSTSTKTSSITISTTSRRLMIISIRTIIVFRQLVINCLWFNLINVPEISPQPSLLQVLVTKRVRPTYRRLIRWIWTKSAILPKGCIQPMSIRLKNIICKHIVT